MDRAYPSEPPEGVMRLGHTLPTNTTSVVFFLSQASRITDLRNLEVKSPKHSPVVARVITGVAHIGCGQPQFCRW